MVPAWRLMPVPKRKLVVDDASPGMGLAGDSEKKDGSLLLPPRRRAAGVTDTIGVKPPASGVARPRAWEVEASTAMAAAVAVAVVAVAAVVVWHLGPTLRIMAAMAGSSASEAMRSLYLSVLGVVGR